MSVWPPAGRARRQQSQPRRELRGRRTAGEPPKRLGNLLVGNAEALGDKAVRKAKVTKRSGVWRDPAVHRWQQSQPRRELRGRRTAGEPPKRLGNLLVGNAEALGDKAVRKAKVTKRSGVWRDPAVHRSGLDPPKDKLPANASTGANAIVAGPILPLFGGPPLQQALKLGNTLRNGSPHTGRNTPERKRTRVRRALLLGSNARSDWEGGAALLRRRTRGVQEGLRAAWQELLDPAKAG